MMRRLPIVVMLLGMTGSLATALAAPPRVVKCVPENGATDVDPGLTELRVTFDQDMAGGFSWVGGGPQFPETRGKPYWVDARTCALPVALKPDHAYALSINSRSYHNFRNRAGETLSPFPWTFRTAAASQGQAGEKLTVADNAAAMDRLRGLIDKRYSYRDLRKLDWGALFAEYKPKVLLAKTPGAFADAVAPMLGEARDPHIWLVAGGRTVAPFHREAERSINVETLARIVPKWQKMSDVVWRGQWPDGTGYLLIASWSTDACQDLEPAFEALDDFADAPALIVDVRPNAGGSETLAGWFAGCFVGKPVVYAKNVYRDPTAPGGWSPVHERTLRPKKARPHYGGRVAVLSGQGVMSSCEAFLLMMKQVPGAVIVGAPSYGSSGNPRPYPLGNGVTVNLPSWKAMRPDGSTFEGEGIAPDILVNARPAEFQKDDPVLRAALKHLHSE